MSRVPIGSVSNTEHDRCGAVEVPLSRIAGRLFRGLLVDWLASNWLFARDLRLLLSVWSPSRPSHFDEDASPTCSSK